MTVVAQVLDVEEISLEDLKIRLIEIGRGHQTIPALEMVILQLAAERGEESFELTDVVERLRAVGEVQVADCVDQAAADLERMGGKPLTQRPPSAPQARRSGTPRPHTAEYAKVRRDVVARLLDGTIPAEDRGPATSGIDESVVEYPWIFERMTEVHRAGGRVLDAGGMMNRSGILDRWLARGFGQLSSASPCHDVPACAVDDAQFQIADLHALPYDDGAFETVLCVSALAHVGQLPTETGVAWSAVLAELRRVAAPGATLLLSVPVGRATVRPDVTLFSIDDVWQLCEGDWADARVRLLRSCPEGWREVAPQEVEGAGYNDHRDGGIRNAPEWVAAAEVVALIELTKPGGVRQIEPRTIITARHPRYDYELAYHADDRFAGGELAAGRYEREESELFRSLLRPESVVLDIGANIGHYSLLASQVVDPDCGGKVWAFEPASENFALLERNLAANGAAWVEARQIAISASSGSVTLGLNDANQGDHRVFSESGRRWGARTETVQARSVDELLAETGAVPTVIKVDVQGHEYFVLQGMRRFLGRRTPLAVFLEFSPSINTYTGVDTAEQWALIERSFERCFCIQPAGGVILPATPDMVLEQCALHEHVNLFLVNGDAI